MRFALGWTGVFLGSAVLLGCSVGDSAGVFHPGDETEVADHTVHATLVFEGPAQAELSPGETRPITIVTSPAKSYEVYFALLDAPGDASLDAARLFTAADGRATIKLHAPSTPASFKLRAWIKDGPTAELAVSVSKQGIATIEVMPDYTGQRPVDEWVASVVAGTSCDALAGELPGEPKGSFVATAPPQQNPLIQSIPVGPNLAVTVRAGHFAWGCADAHDLAAGVSTKVKVHVVDVPLALHKTNLDIALAYAPESQPYAKLLNNARIKFLDTFLPPDQPEGAALLDAMGAAANDGTAFAQDSELGGWGALAAAHFALLQVSLRKQLGVWIDAGIGAGEPVLTGRLEAIEGVQGKALFHAASIGGLDAASAGAPPAHLMSWTSSPNDNVYLGGTIYWLPSRFIGTACLAGATDQLGPLESMADALAQAAVCSDLAASLGGTSACDVGCLADLCRAALTARWHVALDASAADQAVGTVEIGASGVVQVDDIATPIALSGTWLGKISDGETAAVAAGAADGIVPIEEAPPADPGDDPPQ